MRADPDTCLHECSAQNFRRFLNWRLDTSNILKKSAIWVEWKYLRLVYRDETGKRPDDFVGQEVTDVGSSYLELSCTVLAN